MSTTTLGFAWAAVLLAAFVQGSIGVGFALIVAPVLGLIAPAQLPVALLVLMLPLNAFVVWRERAELDLRSAGWITVGRLFGTMGGMQVLALLPARHMNLLIGVSTIAATLVTLLVPAFVPRRGTFMAAGLVTGVTETATGIGGPPLALVYQHHPAAVMRSTIAFCFLLGELMSLAMLWRAGYAEWAHLEFACQLLPALVTGAWLSRLAHGRIQAPVMRGFLLSFSMVSASLLLLRA